MYICIENIEKIKNIGYFRYFRKYHDIFQPCFLYSSLVSAECLEMSILWFCVSWQTDTETGGCHNSEVQSWWWRNAKDNTEDNSEVNV